MRLLPTARLLIFLTIVLLIHFQHRRWMTLQAVQKQSDQGLLQLVSDEFPAANGVMSLRDHPADRGDLADDLSEFRRTALQVLTDADGGVAGLVLRTSPIADAIVGFSGPTDVLLTADADGVVRSIRVLSSEDTPDHLREIQEDADFLSGLQRLKLQELAAGATVDAVSGATLTSHAIQESIRLALSSDLESDQAVVRVPVSLRFPEPPRLDDVRLIFPDAAELMLLESGAGWSVLTADGSAAGMVIRSVPAADNLIGYQGPTETLIGLTGGGTGQTIAAAEIVGVAVGVSYDNEPYVGYVREDEYFRKLFAGRTITQLAELNDSQSVEGVSGATMTSQTVAEGLQLAAAKIVQQAADQERAAIREQAAVVAAQREFRRTVSTVLISLVGVVIALTRLRGNRWLRLAFQLLLVCWLGLQNGDFVSQTLLLGWARNGVPVQHALGLLFLTLAAVIVPMVTGRNVYCSHLCPHGAVQQLLRNRLPWRMRIGPRLQRLLKVIPLLLLGWVILIAMLHLPFSAAVLEPFDGWVPAVAGIPVLLLCLISLAISAVSPMAYCRYGCPTGAVLTSLAGVRRSGWQRRDSASLSLLILAAICFVAASL